MKLEEAIKKIKELLEEEIKKQNLICYDLTVAPRGLLGEQIAITYRLPVKLSINVLKYEYKEARKSIIRDIIRLGQALMNALEWKVVELPFEEVWEYDKEKKVYVEKTEGWQRTVEELIEDIITELQRKTKEYEKTFEELAGKDVLKALEQGGVVYRKEKYFVVFPMGEASLEDEIKAIVFTIINSIWKANALIPDSEKVRLREWFPPQAGIMVMQRCAP